MLHRFWRDLYEFALFYNIMDCLQVWSEMFPYVLNNIVQLNAVRTPINGENSDPLNTGISHNRTDLETRLVHMGFFEADM